MAYLPESSTFDAGVTQLDTTTPVEGGVNGASNVPLKNLANRTNYLKSHLDAIENGTTIPPGVAPLASPTFTGDPKAPTPALGDNDTSIATTAFVQGTVNGKISKSVAGGVNVTLTAVEAGYGILEFTGALTASIAVIVPTAAGQWKVKNATSGAYTLTVKTAAGSGMVVAQGKTRDLICDGTNVLDGSSDTTDMALAGTPTAPTAVAGTNTTQVATTAYVTTAVSNSTSGLMSDTNPLMNGAVAIGASTKLARQDHVHPTDTSRAPLASPTFTGTPAAPTAAANTNSAQIATTAFVVGQAGTATPAMDGVAAVGTSLKYAREDHVHPDDTSKADIASPAFTGTPTVPTAAAGTNNTQAASTAFVQYAANGYLAKSVAGGVNVTLTAAEAGAAILEFTGALTANIAVIVPAASAKWTVMNSTTGAYTLTVKTAAGSGVAVTQGKSALLFCGGTNVVDGLTDFNDIALGGAPTAPTAAVDTSTTQIATTAFVTNQASSSMPAALGTAAVGTSKRYARADHAHQMPTLDALSNTTITSVAAGELLVWNGTAWVNNTLAEAGIAPAASPAFTGNPTAPTPATSDNDTSIATTAFVKAQGYAPLASPALTGTPTAPTPAQFDNDTSIATTAFVQRALGNRQKVIGVTASATLAAADVGSFVEITGGTGITITLPSTTGMAGAAFEFYNNTGNSVTIAAATGQNMNLGRTNVASFSLAAGGNAILVTDGVSWQVLGESMLPYSALFAASKASNGYQKLPSGLIIQWGVASFPVGGAAVTFPIAFPTGVSAVFPGNANTTGPTYAATTPTATGFTAIGSQTANNYWFAIGY